MMNCHVEQPVCINYKANGSEVTHRSRHSLTPTHPGNNRILVMRRKRDRHQSAPEIVQPRTTIFHLPQQSLNSKLHVLLLLHMNEHVGNLPSSFHVTISMNNRLFTRCETEQQSQSTAVRLSLVHLRALNSHWGGHKMK